MKTNRRFYSSTIQQGHLGAQNPMCCAWGWVFRWAAFSLFVSMLSFLIGCSSSTGQTVVQGVQSGGSVSPEAVTQSFFDDLSKALKDPQLSNSDVRGNWAEQIANYFAPTERDTVRIALGDMLDNFANGLEQLAANESQTLELRVDSLQKISETSDRAMVQVNGAIYIQITRTTNTNAVVLYDDTVPFEKILGGPGGIVPVIRIGRTWYLTEG